MSADPIVYLSGYCGGTLPPTIAPIGVGAAIPERKPTCTRRDEATLPILPWALCRHGIDPSVMDEED